MAPDRELQMAEDGTKGLQMIPEAPVAPRVAGEQIHTGKVSDSK